MGDQRLDRGDNGGGCGAGLTLSVSEVLDVMTGVRRCIAAYIPDVWTSGGLCVGAREDRMGRETDLEALGLKTLHIGQVLVACWREPTG